MLVDKDLAQSAIGLQQTGPTGAGSKAGLEAPIDGVTLSDRQALGERAQSRRSVRTLAPR